MDDFNIVTFWDDGGGPTSHSYTATGIGGVSSRLRLQGPAGDFHYRDGWTDFSVDVTPVAQPGGSLGPLVHLELEDQAESGAGTAMKTTAGPVATAEFAVAGTNVTITTDSFGRPKINASIGASGLDGLTDVTLSGPATGEILVKSAGDWINQTLVEAGVSAVGHTHVQSNISDWPLTTARGGTAVVSPGSGNLLIGAGASAMTQMAPGGAGGILVSSGSAWIRAVSATITSAGVATFASLVLTTDLAVAHGGTGLSSSGATGNVLRSQSGAWQSAQLDFADLTGSVPAHNQNASTIQSGTFGAGAFIFTDQVTADGYTASFNAASVINAGTFENVNNANAAAHVRVRIATGGSSGGDPFLNIGIIGAVDWYIGLDNSDSDRFVIGSGSALGPSSGTTRLSLTTTGSLVVASLTLTTDLSVTHGGTGVTNPTSGNLLVGAAGSPMTNLAPAGAGGFVRSDGSAWVRNTIQASDIPTHIHDAADVTTGSFLIARGGTGRTSITSGYLITGSSGGTVMNQLAPGSAGNFVRSSGSAWVQDTIDAGDIATGTLVTDRGGTGLTNPTGGRLILTQNSGADYITIDEGAAGGILVSSGVAWIRAASATITSAGAAAFASLTLTTDLAVAYGGTGVSDPTSGRLLVGAGSSAMTLLSPVTSGNVVRASGSIWASVKLDYSDLAGTPGAHNHDASDIDSGAFLIVRGGTGRTAITSGYLITGSVGGTVMNQLAPGSAGNFVRSSGSAWVQDTIDAGDIASGTLGVARGGTGVSDPISGRLLVTAGTGAFTLLDEGADGGIVVSSGGAWVRAASATITSAGNANFNSLALTNDLTPTHGGTGLSNPTANRVMLTNGGSAFTLVAPTTDGFVLRASATDWFSVRLDFSDLAGSVPTHMHNASDINAGELLVIRGGTGLASPAENQVMLTNGSSPFSLVDHGTTGNVLLSSSNDWVSGVLTVGQTSGNLPAARVAAGTLAGLFIFSSVLRVIAGSATAPSIRGAGGSQSGMYIPTGTAVGITAGGFVRLLVQSTTDTAGYIEITECQIGNTVNVVPVNEIDFNKSNVHTINNTGGRTLTFINEKIGFTYLIIIDPGSGAVNSWTWPIGVKWLGGTAPTLSVTTSWWDQIHLTCIAADTWLGSYTVNHQ